jgi:hypothetical protein
MKVVSERLGHASPTNHVEKIAVLPTKEPTDGIVQTTSPDADVDVEQ